MSDTDERTIGETNIESVVEQTMGGKKNVILDSQILTTLMGCPRLSDFRFNHNFVSIAGKSNSLECGSIVHTFLEFYYRNIINGVRKEQAVGFAFTAAELYISGCQYCTNFSPTVEFPKPPCGHQINQFPGVHNTPKESETKPHKRTGWHYVLDTCDQYIQFYRNDHWVPLEVEVVKRKVLYEDDEVRIMWKAKLDSIFDTNQGIYPTDHKTMSVNRPTPSLNNQFMGQALITNTRSVMINKVGFQTTLPAEEKFKRVPINYSAERLLEWQGETLPFYAKLLLMYAEMGHFPPNYEHCDTRYGSCAFKRVCEADPGMRESEIKRYFMVGPEWNPTNEDEIDTTEE